jgi:hypothetical protein
MECLEERSSGAELLFAYCRNPQRCDQGIVRARPDAGRVAYRHATGTRRFHGLELALSGVVVRHTAEYRATLPAALA